MDGLTSIILPTYCPTPGVEAHLERCLRAIYRNSTGNVELIVVEQSVADKKHFPALKLLGSLRPEKRIFTAYSGSESPIGYAAAVDKGVELAAGDYLLIVNNDIVVRADWDTKLVEKYKATTDAGMISASDIPGPVEDVLEEPRSWWSCVCISRKVWDRVGPLDQGVLNYRYHDQDWSMRAHTMGYVVGRYHGVKVKHEEESATYKHMQVNELKEMVETKRRWGTPFFAEYAATHPRGDLFEGGV